jgi:hypothetical protein
MSQHDTEGDALFETEGAPPSEGPTSVLIAVGLLIVSAYFTIGGLQIPQPEGWQTAPAMLPILLGSTLFIMAAVLLVKAIRGGALRVRMVDEVGDSSLARAGLAIVIVGVFYFGLLEFLPFEVAAILFLFTMLWLYWPDGKLWVRAAIAVGLPILITLCFAAGFGLPLPGEGNLALAVQYLMIAQ